MKKALPVLTLLWVCCSLVLLGARQATAQDVSVTGTVKGPDGQALPGITIQVQGTSTGTTTDANGSYRLAAPANATLVFRGIGYAAHTEPVNGRTTIDVTMGASTEQLSELVVTALGIQKEARELGYAETTIDNSTLTQGKSVNIQQALNGKVSGLNISTVNSGVFENAKINIRGIRSLTGNNQPMLVVDGAPTPLGYLSTIPPDDVEKLTVLKSAASAAIYGPDAVNGVIVITTKRGGEKPTVTLSSTVQATRVSFFPKLQTEFGYGAGETTDQYGNYGYVPYENQQYGPRFDGSMVPLGIPLEDGSIQTVRYAPDHAKDKRKFWNTGLTLQSSVSVSAKDYYLSVDDAKIKGLVPDDENHRTSFRFNSNKEYGKLSINYGLNYIQQNYDVLNESGIQNTFPSAYDGGLFFAVMQVSSAVPLLDYKDWKNNKFAQFSNYYNEYAFNPYWLIGNIREKGREDDLLGNIDVNYQFLPWLKATVRLSTNLAFQNFKQTNAPLIISDWAKNEADVDGSIGRNATQYSDRKGIVVDGESYSSRINLDYFVSGSAQVSEPLKLHYVAGGTIRQNRSKDVTVGGNDLVVPYLYNVSVRSGDANVPLYATGNYNITSTLLSAYASVGVSYKGWANVEITGRNDWDSRLSKENRSFFYPAADASLILSDALPSLHNSGVLSYLKVRAAVSKSGNVNLNPYSLQPTYSQPAGFPYDNNAGFTANGTFPSKDLKPEFVNTIEGGVELGFLRDRINLEGTYFFQKNTDQIIQISQSSTTGYTIALANAADFKNYGVEMALSLTPLVQIGRGHLDFRINATYNNNEVTHTLNNTPVVIGGSDDFIQNSVSSPSVHNVAMVGRPAFAFQMTDYKRDSATGKVIVDPVTGYPTQAGDEVIRGRTLPLWVVGTTLSYSIGGLSVAMTWDYKGGHDFYSGLGSDEDFAGISQRSVEYGRQRFVFPNSVYLKDGKYVPNTNIQVQDGNSNFWASANRNAAIATNYFASAAAWRLRELNISYNLPFNWIGTDNIIKRITVSAVGKNLFLFVPKSNQWGDPEFNYSSTGNTFGVASSFQSPASRLVGGSVTVQF